MPRKNNLLNLEINLINHPNLNQSKKKKNKVKNKKSKLLQKRKMLSVH